MGAPGEPVGVRPDGAEPAGPVQHQHRPRTGEQQHPGEQVGVPGLCPVRAVAGGEHDGGPHDDDHALAEAVAHHEQQGGEREHPQDEDGRDLPRCQQPRRADPDEGREEVTRGPGREQPDPAAPAEGPGQAAAVRFHQTAASAPPDPTTIVSTEPPSQGCFPGGRPKGPAAQVPPRRSRRAGPAAVRQARLAGTTRRPPPSLRTIIPARNGRFPASFRFPGSPLEQNREITCRIACPGVDLERALIVTVCWGDDPC